MKKLLVLIIVCLSFSSCLATKKYHVVDNDKKQIQEKNGITVVCEYLDEGDLAKRHGRGDDNLYIDREWVLTPVYSLVFEVEIKNKTSMAVKYDSRETELYFGEKATRAAVVSDFETRLEDQKNTKGSDKLAQIRLAKKTMYRNIVRVRPGESYKGYIVFTNNFRQRGECIMHLPLLYNSGNVAEEFEFTYQISKKKQ
ncbi:MAG: hypothetical protein IJM77_07510 [Spirochaetia bacterium]|nr:hypothetical protein [Spirochaetia bacterium]MBQ6904741.1 hypothetical protein [Spirochaetia bacterium]MBR0318864.1 hypothetical protein [Spirochaetia bacterium]